MRDLFAAIISGVAIGLTVLNFGLFINVRRLGKRATRARDRWEQAEHDRLVLHIALWLLTHPPIREAKR